MLPVEHIVFPWFLCLERKNSAERPDRKKKKKQWGIYLVKAKNILSKQENKLSGNQKQSS